MKKKTIIGISLAVAAMLALGALAAYLTYQFKDDLFFSASDTQAQQEAEAVLSALQEPVTEAATEKATEAMTEAVTEAAASTSDDMIIWVGDSRTVGMGRALDNDNVYIGADGEGYTWLYETGVTELSAAIRQYPDAPVVFNFGVNDCDDIDSYLDLYQAIEAEYPDTHFYYLSVNPIEPTLCENVTNEEISDFNSSLRSAFPDQFIDSFTFLMVNQVTTIDGVHYSEADYQNIYSFASAQVAAKEAAS
jgi:hypothetical protein